MLIHTHARVSEIVVHKDEPRIRVVYKANSTNEACTSTTDTNSCIGVRRSMYFPGTIAILVSSVAIVRPSPVDTDIDFGW